eukprot:scaffold1866_cov112-Isochrysis_galbana.AAC.2
MRARTKFINSSAPALRNSLLEQLQPEHQMPGGGVQELGHLGHDLLVLVARRPAKLRQRRHDLEEAAGGASRKEAAFKGHARGSRRMAARAAALSGGGGLAAGSGPLREVRQGGSTTGSAASSTRWPRPAARRRTWSSPARTGTAECTLATPRAAPVPPRRHCDRRRLLRRLHHPPFSPASAGPHALRERRAAEAERARGRRGRRKGNENKTRKQKAKLRPARGRPAGRSGAGTQFCKMVHSRAQQNKAFKHG